MDKIKEQLKALVGAVVAGGSVVVSLVWLEANEWVTAAAAAVATYLAVWAAKNKPSS